MLFILQWLCISDYTTSTQTESKRRISSVTSDGQVPDVSPGLIFTRLDHMFSISGVTLQRSVRWWCFHSWLRALATPHADNTRTHTLSHTVWASCQSFPVYTAESRRRKVEYKPPPADAGVETTKKYHWILMSFSVGCKTITRKHATVMTFIFSDYITASGVLKVLT